MAEDKLYGPALSDVEKKYREMRDTLTAEQEDKFLSLLPEKFPPWMSMAMTTATTIADATKDLKVNTNILAHAVEAGSKEGYSLSVRNQFGDAGTDRIVNAMNANVQKMIDVLRGIGIVI